MEEPWFLVYITKEFCAHRSCMLERWDCNFRYILWRSPWLAIVSWINSETAIFGICYTIFAACIHDETTIFGIYYKEARCSLSLNASTVIPRFSVCIIKKLCARRCRMYQWWDCKFCMYHKEALCSLLRHASRARPWFSVYIMKKKRMACSCWTKGETTILCMCYKALCMPLLDVLTARLQVSVYIIKRLSACCCCKHQWRGHDFRYMLYRSSVLAIDVYPQWR